MLPLHAANSINSESASAIEVNTATVIACHGVRLFPGRSNNRGNADDDRDHARVSSPMSLYEPAASGSQGLTSIGCSGIPSGTSPGGEPHAAERQCNQRKQASDSCCADDVQRQCRAGKGDRPRSVVLNAIETRGHPHGLGRVPADDRQAGEDGKPGADGEQQRRNPGIQAEGAGDRHRVLRTPQGQAQ